jgi:tetratricopeptide (TPR) repeat protein
VSADRPTAAELFEAASRLSGGERAALLESRCGPDTALRSEVESLLAHFDQASGFLEDTSPFLRSLPGGSPSSQAGGPNPDGILTPGTTVGKYKILGVLGQGGMGFVYLAQQASPRREVALKVIRPGIATPSMLRRFEHEGHVLGRLQHPGIAQIFEAGAADIGYGQPQPFFAMELVKGVILTEFAELRRLNVRERLDLMVRVCNAVQHAHQRGLIHRDLKPGNILVSAEGQPKVLDFGVARATDSDIQATTIQTDVGQLVGTLPYMSPEQVAADPLALDTRSDVYALGVILYELLTGRLPHDVKRKMIPEAVRIIRDQEPTRLSSINKVFRGDIETIVGKALEKDRDRRYQSAAELADDIRRFLRDEPLVARPPSRTYQLRKFAKRNKAVVVGVAAVFLVLVLGVVGTSIGLARAIASEAKAQAEAAQAQREAAKARRVTDILERMFRASDPDQSRGREITAREVLDNASALVRGELDSQPEVAAEVNMILAEVYSALGLQDNALAHAGAAIDSARRAGPVADEPLAMALIVQALRAIEGDRLDAARASLDEAEAVAAGFDPASEAATELINVQAQLAEAEGRNEEADRLYLLAVERATVAHGPNAPATLRYKNNLAVRLGGLGRLEESIRLQQEALDGRIVTLGPLHPETAISWNNLGSALRQAGRYEEAEAKFREALRIRETIYDADHTYIGSSLNSIAATRRSLGDRAGAEPLYRRALAIYRKRLGPAHPRLASMLQNLASLRQDLGDLEEAQALYNEALQMQFSLTGGDDLSTALILGNLATLQVEQGDLAGAEASARRVLAIREKLQEPGHPQMGLAKGNLASTLIRAGRFDEAEPLLDEAIAIYENTYGARHPFMAAALKSRATILLARGDAAGAEAALRTSIEIYLEKSPNNLDFRGRAVLSLAEALQAQGRLDEAEKELLDIHEQLGALPDLARLRETARAQIEAFYRDTGREEEAARWAAAAATPADQPVAGGG